MSVLTSGTIWRAVILGGLAISLLTGCATRPEESQELRTVTSVHAQPIFVGATSERVERVEGIREDGHLEILAISAGGSSGAFGAGVINGWSAAGTRPDFDIVTGVSTGALIAILAFAGPEFDDELKRAYTEVDDEDIYVERNFISGLASGSFYDYSPLMQLIEDTVTEEVIDKVGEEYKKGRRLYVASTNLDGGLLTVWDVGALAASDRHNRLLRIRKMLRASTAVPGYFEPVYIKPRNGIELRQAHIDGAVKTPLLLESFMLNVPAQKRTVYVIVNKDLLLENDSEPVEATVMDVARKSLSELLRSGFEQALFRAFALSRFADAEFNVAWIPDDANLIRNGLSFDPVRMGKLYEKGTEVAVQRSWEDEPPHLSALVVEALN